MNTSMMIPQRYVSMARAVVERLPAVLAGRGLTPAFRDFVLTDHAGHVWLFAALDVDAAGRLEQYTAPATIHHLSAALRGLPVYVSNSSGLRYAVLLSQRPRLPRRADFPDDPGQRGVVRLGAALGGPLAVRWSELGHVLVAGMTGAGKSNFLRVLAYQAVRDGGRLLLADLDGRTFPMLADNPALLAPVAQDPAGVQEIVARALGECDHRAALYNAVAGFPDDVDEYNALAGGDPLPRLLVVLDEFNATVEALGGARGGFAGDVARLAWRGRKFGVTLIFAAQDFAKAVIGRVRDQARTAVVFRVQSAELARAVGCAGAHRIPESLPGRALTDRWGLVQTYYLEKARLGSAAPPALAANELALVRWALEENAGYLGRADLQRAGLGKGAAERLALDWERRGWLEKDPRRGNCRRITPALATLASGQPGNPGSGGQPGSLAG